MLLACAADMLYMAWHDRERTLSVALPAAAAACRLSRRCKTLPPCTGAMTVLTNTTSHTSRNAAIPHGDQVKDNGLYGSCHVCATAVARNLDTETCPRGTTATLAHCQPTTTQLHYTTPIHHTSTHKHTLRLPPTHATLHDKIHAKLHAQLYAVAALALPCSMNLTTPAPPMYSPTSGMASSACMQGYVRKGSTRRSLNSRGVASGHGYVQAQFK